MTKCTQESRHSWPRNGSKILVEFGPVLYVGRFYVQFTFDGSGTPMVVYEQGDCKSLIGRNWEYDKKQTQK